jgi:hypothetical protein
VHTEEAIADDADAARSVKWAIRLSLYANFALAGLQVSIAEWLMVFELAHVTLLPLALCSHFIVIFVVVCYLYRRW